MSNEWLKNDKPLAGQMGDPDDPYGINIPKAGRELDALVAEKVMDLAWDEARCRVCGWPLDSLTNAAYVGCQPDNCSMRPRPKRRADECAHYSTDIRAAWLVVDKMRSRFGWTAPLWHAALADIVSLSAPEAALKICRAAITAVSAAPGRADD